MPTKKKANILTEIILASAIVLISFPLYIFLYLDPAFVNFVTTSSEREAVKIANYITLTLFPKTPEFNETFLTSDKEVQLTELQHELQIIKVKIFKPDGTIIYSTDKEDVGQINTHDYFKMLVAQGQLYTKVVQKNTVTMEGQTMPIDVVETYVPIMHGNAFVGAFEIYYDNTIARKRLRQLLRNVSISVSVMAVFLMAVVIYTFINALKNLNEKNTAEEALRQAHDELETRVITRTQQLTQVNDTLNQEIETRRSAEKEKERLIEELTEALKQVKTLSGLLPICSSCRQIRDDNGKWHKVEDYFRTRTDAEFTHGICPKCAKQLYPDLYENL
ncbi:MAG: hypothetical protein KKD63_04360 [Proteobacteria bacterium]|nr:hypothetical protein [Desulfobulbaceae bacterium]MBU4152094.1 hypothetical protein [Pseudomonadota bacterium]